MNGGLQYFMKIRELIVKILMLFGLEGHLIGILTGDIGLIQIILRKRTF